MSDTTKRIIYQNPNLGGGISIVVPAEKCHLTIDEIRAKDVPSGVTSYIVDTSTIPTDRSFRNAWTYTP